MFTFFSHFLDLSMHPLVSWRFRLLVLTVSGPRNVSLRLRPIERNPASFDLLRGPIGIQFGAPSWDRSGTHNWTYLDSAHYRAEYSALARGHALQNDQLELTLALSLEPASEMTKRLASCSLNEGVTITATTSRTDSRHVAIPTIVLSNLSQVQQPS